MIGVKGIKGGYEVKNLISHKSLDWSWFGGF